MKSKVLSILSACLGLAAIERDASAFSTGGHFVATESALKRAGFDANGIRYVQASNYGIDHATNIPDEAMTEGSVAQRTKNVARYFHFDAVVTNFAMLHLAQPDVAIGEAHRVLRPGGRYGFTVWAAPQLAIDQSDAPEGYGMQGHIFAIGYLRGLERATAVAE